MSLNIKVRILSGVVMLVIVGYASVRYYRHTHPRSIAPREREEVTLTIIPGWNLRQVAHYLVQKGFASTTQDVYNVTGIPAKDYRQLKLQAPTLVDEDGFAVPPDRTERNSLSYEGYIAPETIRVFKDASVSDIIIKFLKQRQKEIKQIVSETEGGSIQNWPDIITMASIVEEEAKTPEDRRIVADILWRRVTMNWALQVDSSVHYAVDKTGTVFTTEKDREVDSPWNTYKYPGLPIGPIANPSIDSIKAAYQPTKNEYWYFLSGKDGKMHYAKTFEEHNANKKYL